MKNVVSLFDGISCLQIALERAKIPYENYYSSEVDKHCITITQNNYPSTIQIGDICDLEVSDFPQDIDLFCALVGSKNLSLLETCQDTHSHDKTNTTQNKPPTASSFHYDIGSLRPRLATYSHQL